MYNLDSRFNTVSRKTFKKNNSALLSLINKKTFTRNEEKKNSKKQICLINTLNNFCYTTVAENQLYIKV